MGINAIDSKDKAELYAHLIINCAELEARAKQDQVLAAKAQRMKELLYRFCQEFDEAFWNCVQ